MTQQDLLSEAARDADDAERASEMMLEILQEYVRAEQAHAQRLQAICTRLDQLAPIQAPASDEGRAGAAMVALDCVTTFMARCSQAHRQLSENLLADLCDEWQRHIDMDKQRVYERLPEKEALDATYEQEKQAYSRAHSNFVNSFNEACTALADAVQGGVSIESIQNYQQDSTTEDRPEDPRQACCNAYMQLNKTHVGRARLYASLRQEYSCILNSCISRMHGTVRKVAIHISSLTSNIQYDATQLFELADSSQPRVMQDNSAVDLIEPAYTESSISTPPGSETITLEHLVSRNFPAETNPVESPDRRDTSRVEPESFPHLTRVARKDAPLELSRLRNMESPPLDANPDQATQASNETASNVNKHRTLVDKKRSIIIGRKRISSEKSLGCFAIDHPLRKLCIQVSTSRFFDTFIILTIMANSAILGLADYTVVDDHLNPNATGIAFINNTLVPNVISLQNTIINHSEAPFTAIFTAECIIKIIALGFSKGKGAYLRDSWNVLDFFVVVSSLVSILPNMPNVSAIRTIRVLRPLRSLSVIPGMRRLITALLKALPALGNVVILQFFVFVIFGILGIQLFVGAMNQRCRTTNFPVKLELNSTGGPIWPPSPEYLATLSNNATPYKCIDGPNLDVPDNDTAKFNQTSSPWRTPQPCFWPVNEDDTNLCTATEQPGNHKCLSNEICGSNFDVYGNPRFNLKRAMNHPLYNSNLNYGYTSFDNIFYAFFAIFQSITTAGWTSIMYELMDSWTPVVSAMYFVVLIVFGSMFVMNLTVAVISDEFNIDDEIKAPVKKPVPANKNGVDGTQKPKARYPFFYKIVSDPYFTSCVMIAIAANTTILSLDHYPMSEEYSTNLEMINFGLSTIFLLEMVLKLIGLGFKEYAKDRFNLFDAFIVTMGLLETIASPPTFLIPSAAGASKYKKGPVSALRSFRLFRVFKLARNWRSLREMLELIGRAVMSIANFAVLLFIFIYIYALIGLQFFGNSMHFDDEGYPINDVSPEFFTATVPRANFDTILVAFVTVFQIITLDNWNNILYDGVRGNGFGAAAYFFSLVIMGNFILMNLFLALLLDNFSTTEEDPKEKEDDMKNLARRMATMKVVPINDVSEKKLSAPNSAFDVRRGSRAVTMSTLHENGDADDADDAMAKQVTNLDDLMKEMPVSKTKRLLVPTLNIGSQRRLDLGVSVGAPSSTPNELALTPNTATLLKGNMIAVETIEPSDDTAKTDREDYSTGVPLKDQVVMSNSKWSWVMRKLEPVVAKVCKVIGISNEDEDTDDSRLPEKGRSLYIFSSQNRIRQFCFTVVRHSLFDSFILVLITLSSLSLALDNPLRDPHADFAVFLRAMDSVFTVIFLVEMTMKIIAYGLVLHKRAYLRNNWNILDCVIVIISVLMMVTDALAGENNLSTKKLHSLRSLRSLRAFRPLRMISRRPGLKLVVNALFEAIPSVLNVMFVCMLIYLMFSIIAVNYLKGTMRSCDQNTLTNLTSDQVSFLTNPLPWIDTTDDQQSWFIKNASCVGFPHNSTSPALNAGEANGTWTPTSRYICECFNGTWDHVIYEHFDNVAWAMMTFFEMSTTENWDLIMWAAVDVVDVDMQPVQNNQMLWTLFFVAFMLIGGFFVVNLLVGVIIDNFNRMKDALGGDFLLTPEQKKWIEAQKTASRVGPIRVPKPPKNPYRRFIFFQIRKPWFEWFIMLCILGNTIIMSFVYVGQSETQEAIVDKMNMVFAGIFTAESVAKIIAFGVAYFEETWNQFDFFVVVATIASTIIEAVTGTNVRTLVMIVRVIRVTRILRLVKASKSVRQILMTLYISLPGLSNIMSILILMLFIYATMGVQMFAKIKLHDNIDTHGNFQDFGTAMLFLFRVTTGESWDFCMHDFAKRTKDCDDDPEYDPTVCGFNNFEGCTPINGCGTGIAYAYFNSFTLLVSYVMLNLTIAVILEGFSQSVEDEEPLFEPELLSEFQLKWADIDPRATGYVKVTRLTVLVNILNAPLGKAGITAFSRVSFISYMHDLRLPIYEGETVYFKDVLLAMTREMVKETVASDPNALANVEPPVDDEPDRLRLDFFAHQYFAVCTIQRSVSDWLRTKRALEAQYMEEYKNKIKKPSGRPKKVRDARVYSVG
ncbi:TPA: hypothetical protein N0F65_011865 [Lagenidium giganteum]|uniref:Uncharacterized protein n=1 Tax=Lagenidium giganteum TaxID=4803 RepID=A0AAV2YMH4_9STRA|nr:TPA: hypothetical protein N0F65_011865 [Lagenidium giganteum]